MPDSLVFLSCVLEDVWVAGFYTSVISLLPALFGFNLPETLNRGSRSLQNLVAISMRHCQSLLTLKAGCIIIHVGYNWLLRQVD